MQGYINYIDAITSITQAPALLHSPGDTGEVTKD